MATIRAYTTIEQAKKLAEILSIESADMYYEPSTGFCTEPSEAKFGDIKYAHPRSIRCWSLAALLDVLPKGTDIIKEEADTENEKYMCTVGIKDDIMSTFASNPVDACVEMILKLHKQNLL